MKILISGINSNIGYDFVNFFKIHNKIEIAGICRSNKRPNYKKIKIYKINLKNKIKKKIECDALIHLASLNPNKKYKKKDFTDVNKLGFQNLLNNLINCKKIIYFSTINVYGKIDTKLVDENYKGKKIDYYGLSKLEGEKFLMKYSRKKNINYLILRLPGVLTKNFKGENFITKIIQNIKNDKEIEIFNPEKKFNNIINTLTIFNIILDFFKKNKKSCIMNCASTRPVKLIKIIKGLNKNLKKKEKIKIKNKNKNKNKNSNHFLVDITKGLKNKYKFQETNKTINQYI